MGRNRVTLTDLARTLELSTCTVSKILNRSFDGFTYSKETIRRVEECAQKLGYTPNAQARSLRTRKTMLIGFILPSAQISLFGALTDRLELELRNRGYQVLIVHSRSDASAEPMLLASLLARGIDGLIWIPAAEEISPSKVGLKKDFPAVILDRPFCTDALPFVATENRAAARELAQRAYDLGHRQVGILNAPEGDRSLRERFEGFAEGFAGGKIRLIDLPNDAGAAKTSVAKLVSGRSRVSLVVALSEPLALGAIAGIRDLGLNLGPDLSFAAFDDFPLAAHWSPRITVVRQNVEVLASETAALLLARIESPGRRFDNVRVQADLKWRESVVGA